VFSSRRATGHELNRGCGNGWVVTTTPRIKILLCASLSLSFPACGGGGSDDDPVTTTGVTTTDDGTTGGASGGTSGGTSTTDESTTGATSDDGSSSGGSTSMAFIMEPDSGVSAECDIWAQDCQDGEKCAPWANDGGNSWNATRCVPESANPKEPGDSCTTDGSDVSGNDDCIKGSLCFSVNPETNEGICTAFCQGSEASPTCADPNAVCNISNNGSLILCLPTCNPMLQDCPTTGQPQGCYPVNDEFLCWPDFSFDLGSYGDPCEYFNVCDPGLYCGAAEVVPGCIGSVGCCTEYCDTTDANASCAGASDGAECVPWWDANMAPPGLENVGACILPT
jgi:hypothetical protein